MVVTVLFVARSFIAIVVGRRWGGRSKRGFEILAEVVSLLWYR